MASKPLAEMSDEELLKAAALLRKTSIYDAVFFGALVGIAIYSSVKNGVGLLTFLPLVYLPVARKNKAKRNQAAKLLAERGLK